MKKPSFDPGLTQQFTGSLRRAINKDGSFNVRRRGTSWRDTHPYLHMINMRWLPFLTVLFLLYLAVNTIFAAIYYGLGPGHLTGAEGTTAGDQFLNAFFFSAHTLTTVGYGSISPRGTAANLLAALEAMIGLMGFALATGLLFGRFSKPSARIGFSERLLLAPYQGGLSLQFRIVNLRDNVLMDLEARLLLMTVEGPPDQRSRRYHPLNLERDKVLFFPLTWTIVHPIDEGSPLYGKTPAEWEALQAEVLIQLKGYDDTFSQTVNVRHSYRYDEVVREARFSPSFHTDQAGDMVLHVDRVGVFERVEPQRVLEA
jgi:inward rectifier potassium channel